METIKTAVVVVLLLAVLYGVYVVLNKPELSPPPEVAWVQDGVEPPQVDLGTPAGQVPLQPLPLDKQAAPSAQPPAPAGATGLDLIAPPHPLVSIGPAPTSPPAEPARAGVETASPAGSVATVAGTQPVEAAPAQVAPVSGATDVNISDHGSTESAERPPVAENKTPQPPTSIYQNTADSAAKPAERAAMADQTAPPRSGTDSIYGSSPSNSTAAAENPAQDRAVRKFDTAWSDAVAKLDKKDWAAALLTLSPLYSDAEISSEERERLIDLLDPLAGKVIYSTAHTLLGPYQVRPGETLDQIAEQHRVPVTLLQNINGIANPTAVQPGMTLKVVPGPFRAEVDLKNGELVLFLREYYAGRFSISICSDPTPKQAECKVLDKQFGRDYVASDGTRIAARAAGNPYGAHWIDLGSNLGIHGSPETLPSHGSLGCIALSGPEAADVFGILSKGSKVVIR